MHLSLGWRASGSDFFGLPCGGAEGILERPMNRLAKHGLPTVVRVGAAVAAAVLALMVAELVSNSDLLAQRVRYTSICTRCGLQTAQDFYLILGTEVFRYDKVLAASGSTKIRSIGKCSHDSALIGKSGWIITKEFATATLETGEPQGWNYQGSELEKQLSALAVMRPAESIRYVQALARGPVHLVATNSAPARPTK